MTRTDRLAVTLAALIGGAFLSHPSPARAELVFTVEPTVSVGYATNPGVATTTPGASPPAGDGLVILSSSERLLYKGATAEYEVGYRLALTRYMRGQGVDNTSHELAAASLFHLSASTDLRLSATGMLSRTSGIITAVAPTSTPQAAVPGSTQFVSVTGGEDLNIEATPRWRFVQSLHLATVNYVNVPIDPATRTSVTALGRVEHPLGLDTPLLELQATDFVLTGGPPGAIPPTPDQNVFLEVLAGWRREINPVWSTELRGGLTTLVRSAASTVYVPTGSAQVTYKRVFWTATLTASQEPLPNLFSGQATINDSVIAHVTLPIGRTEQLVLTGAGGYVYARIADAAGTLHHTYDQWSLLSLLSYRFLKAPLFASLSYSIVDQTGGTTDLRRQIVMLNLTGLFMWGPGTPPLFGGGGL